MKNIILVGYRCTGKTSVGRKLSNVLNRPFIDTDNLVTEKAGLSIREIVNQGGWKLFRKKEKEVAHQASTSSGQIIATGGGILDDDENRRLLQRNGLFIWLTASSETILARMQTDEQTNDQRPALCDADQEHEIAIMLAQREPAYRQAADLIIDTSDKSIDDVVDDIIGFVSPHNTDEN
ncbi:MAG TPA: shikimate kinase [Deltaproteobacteria bacterium]|nr:shikimate kinase [Deltaproteobacteria bacterium]